MTMRLECQRRAVRKYQKQNIVMKTVNFNKRTEADLIAHLGGVENFGGYVKELIRRDMQNGEQK